MALKYMVLERFSEEARRKTAERVFDRIEDGSYVCLDNLCVMGALLRDDNRALEWDFTPWPFVVAARLDIPDDKNNEEFREIETIIRLNDSGALASPEAVRSLLLGD